MLTLPRQVINDKYADVLDAIYDCGGRPRDACRERPPFLVPVAELLAARGKGQARTAMLPFR